MTSVVIQTRVPAPLKKDAERLFESVGLSLSDAVRVFLQQSLNEGGLPFKPHAKRPNAETIQAMQELENGGGERFKSADALFEAWDART